MWDFQENGWMDDRIGERWFKEIFLKQCGTGRPQVLILDEHSSHESLALILSPAALTEATIVTCVLIALVRPGTFLAPFSAMTFTGSCSEDFPVSSMFQANLGLSKRFLSLQLKTPFKNSTPGKDWWQKLKQRHSDLTIRKPEKTGTLR
jgi:hypothetical protein